MSRGTTLLLAAFLCVALPTTLVAQDAAKAQAKQLEQALELVRPSADPDTLITMLQSVSYAHLLAGDTDLAARRIGEAIGLCREHNRTNQVRPVLLIAGQILSKVDPDTATAFLASLLKLGDDPDFEAVVLDVLGQNLLSSGRVVLAITAYRDFHGSVRKRKPGSAEEAEALLNYGKACILGRMPDLGLPALKQGMAIAEKLGNRQLAALFPMQMGMGALRAGQVEFAANAFLKQLQLAEATNDQTQVDVALQNLVTAFLRQGDLEAATRTATRLQKEGSSAISKASGVSYLALVDVLKADLDAAITKQRSAIAAKLASYTPSLRASIGDELVLFDNVALAAYQLLDGRQDEAANTLQQAERGSLAASRRRETAVQSGAMSSDEANLVAADIDSSISEFRQQVFVNARQYADALVSAENGRARAQRLLMQARLGLQPQDIPKPTTTALRELIEIARQQRTTIVEYSLVHRLDPISRSLIGESHPLSRPSSLYVWVIPPGGEVSFHALELHKPIGPLVDAARQLLRSQPPQQSAESSNAKAAARPKDAPTADDLLRILHQILIEPIAAALPGDPQARVTIIPQGELYLVPFAALPDANGTPLIAKHTLLTAPSAATISLAASQQARSRGLANREKLIVGNPTMPLFRARPDKPPHQLDPLKGAEIEAQLIGQMLKSEPLIGPEATESAVTARMENAAVIHLASHGLLEADNVFSQSYLSAIALAADDSEDGYLTVRETMGLKLSAELAVLSACDSGRGRITGDGVLGLTRAYIAAGVPTVVVSLWPVSDQATAVLMTTYYDRLQKGSDKAAALREAMLATRERFPNPRLWAPFTLYGVGG